MGKKKAVKAISLLWLGSILGAGFAFISQVILARHFGPLHYGNFSSAMVTVTTLVPLAGFGVAQFWLKAFGEEGWGAIRWLKPSFQFVVLSSFVVVILIMAWAFGGPHDDTLKFLLLTLSIYVLGQVSIELVSGMLQLEERYLSLAFWQLFPHLLRLVLILILVFYFSDWLIIQTIALAYASIAIGVTLLGAIKLSHMLAGTFDLKGHGARSNFEDLGSPRMPSILLHAWPFGVAALFQLIYFQSDIILVKYMIGAEAAGIYQVAFMIMAALYILPSVIYQKFMLPKMHRWANYDRIRFRQVYRQGNIVMLVMGVLAMLIIIASSGSVILWLFGDRYEGSVRLLNLLSVSAPMVFVAFNAGATLVTQAHMRRKVKYMGGVALVNIVLNIALIPSYGAMGAALATVLSNAVLLLIYHIGVRKWVFGQDYQFKTTQQTNRPK